MRTKSYFLFLIAREWIIVTCPKSVKTAAIISQVILVLWIWLTILSNIFQRTISNQFFGYGLSYIENIERAFPWTVAAMCIADLVITAANFFICRGKCKIAPLVMTAVTTGILPIVSSFLRLIQFRFVSLTEVRVSDRFAILNCAYTIGAMLSYFLYAAAVITIAAAAVYAYSQKGVTENQSVERSDYEPPYNIN